MAVSGSAVGAVEAVLLGALPGLGNQEVSEELVWQPWEAWLPLIFIDLNVNGMNFNGKLRLRNRKMEEVSV
jgi:hypothetical protein